MGITVSAWVKPTVNFEGSGNDAIVDKGFTSHSAPYYQYHLGICGTYCGSGGHYFSFCCAVNGVGYGKYTHPLQWVINNWYHVVGTYDGTYMRIYINGTCNDSMAVSGSLSTYNTDVFNGKFRNVNYFSPIDVDEIRIYNRALTKTEINMLYKDLPNAPSNLSASAVSGSRINLSWTDNSANEDGFKIERKTGTGSYTEIGTVGPNISTFACQNLQPCSDNTYRIRAYNSGGNSEYSNDANARTYCNYIKLNTSGITSGYTYTVSGEGIPITSFATGQVDSVPLVSSSENAEFFIHVNGGSMNEALDLKFIAGSSQGIRNVQVLKNGAYVPFKQDYFEIPQKLALVFMPWKNNNSQNSLIHLVLKDGILLTPTMQGSFNLLQITGLEQITNFSIKIFSLTGLLVFDNTNKTSFWDGKDMTTNVLVLKGIYKYIIQADSHSLSGELMVDY